ncbi:MAG: hypothetical protein WDN06_03050 [Asticcacaulis sp.]
MPSTNWRCGRPDTFDARQIDWELGLAEHTGMTTMRVFLQDQLWTQDSQGFLGRMDQFLAIAQKHHIRPVFVLFDSCWDAHPHLGKQKEPTPGVHNSGWVQSLASTGWRTRPIIRNWKPM